LLFGFSGFPVFLDFSGAALPVLAFPDVVCAVLRAGARVDERTRDDDVGDLVMLMIQSVGSGLTDKLDRFTVSVNDRFLRLRNPERTTAAHVF